ncbi:EamA family transporter [Rhodobacteraceae bacterium IMCC1335]|jgi:drug/metabolite transporter (DMT)-like permease
MLGAVFLFTVMDAIAKQLTKEVGLIQTIWVRYTGQALLVFLIVLPRLREVAKSQYPKLQLLRSVVLMAATCLFFLSISKIGLAEATAIMDINPVLITLGAFLFLGEKIGPRRILGIIASMIGALIIIRPGTDVFTVYAVLPLVAAVCYTTYNLTTRFVGNRESPWTSLLYSALFGAVVFSCMVPFFWQPVSLFSAGLMVLLSLCGTFSQLFLIRALAIGEASLLAPFAYVGLIYATIWGLVFFGEFPDEWSIIGAIIIAISGFYVWYRDTFGSKSEAEDAN